MPAISRFRCLKNKHSALLGFLILSLLVHIFFVRKVGLPLKNIKSAQAIPLEIHFQEKQVASDLPPITPSIAPIIKPESTKVLEKTSESNLRLEKTNAIPNTKTGDLITKNTSGEIIEIKPSLEVPFDNLVVTPREIYLEFNIIGGDGKLLGLAQQHFVSDSLGNYQLISKNKASDMNTGDEDWQFEVTGRLYGNRLSPSTYHTNGKLAERLLILSRESKNGEAITKIVRAGRMPDGILDLQSLMYQFMFSPPKPNDSELVLSDGAKISTYTLKILGVEIFDSSTFGKINTIHILLSNQDNNESIDLWLAPTFNYIPLKVHHGSNSSDDFTDLITSTLTIK